MKTCPKILALLELNRMMLRSQLIFDKSVYFFQEQENARIASFKNKRMQESLSHTR